MVEVMLIYLLTVVLTTVSFALIPMTMPDTLQFGVRIPPAFVSGAKVTGARRNFYRRWWGLFIFQIVISALFAIFVTSGAESCLWLVWFVVVMVLNFFNYFAARSALLRVKDEEQWYANYVESIVADTRVHSHSHAPSLAWALPAVLIMLVSIVIGAAHYPSLPHRIAVHFGLNGEPNRYAAKSVWSVFGPFLTEIILIFILAAVHLGMRRFSVRLDPSRPDASRLRNRTLQRVGMQAVWILIAFVNAGLLLSFLPVWGVVHGHMVGFENATLVLMIIGIVVMLLMLVRAAQAGRHVDASAMSSKLVHRDDDRFWKGGAIYVNREDSSFMVPKRFGIGWTVNFGHPLAWLVLVLIIAVIVTVSVLPPA